jgi:hypothetical protein
MITLITPTRDRPEAFALCEKYVARQTYKGPLQWIVVDDGDVPAKTTMGQTYLRRPVSGSPNTLAPNLLEAIKHIDPSTEAVFFIEDDDWYSPGYIDGLLPHLKGREIVGLGCHRYYNVSTRRWKIFSNSIYAGLCVTAIAPSMLGWLTQSCKGAIEDNDPWVDLRLWCANPKYPQRNHNSYVLPNYGLSVGIKRMPGRTGLGSGHGVNDPADFFIHFDEHGQLLQVWTGDDAEGYLQYGLPHLPRKLLKREPTAYTVSVVFQRSLPDLQKCIQTIYVHSQKTATLTEIIVTDNRGKVETLPYLINMEVPIPGLPSFRSIHNTKSLSVEECHANAQKMAWGKKHLELVSDVGVNDATIIKFFSAGLDLPGTGDGWRSGGPTSRLGFPF